ncbi:MAG TPA: hypothetical protein VMH33_12875 [Solirubrobacterales bacterium]|nr:hypothetical protein [Solirubrobacterales bacterium]
MPVPVLGHVPGFFAIASASLALSVGVVRFLAWSIHELLDVLRDLRRFRRGE